jgi:hypothetical protein
MKFYEEKNRKYFEIFEMQSSNEIIIQCWNVELAMELW